MRNALEKLQAAISGDVQGLRTILSMRFEYGDIEVEYMGRFYAYVHPANDSRARCSEEYCWGCYDEMLSAQIGQTGKTVQEMLQELPEHDLEIEYDVPLPPSAVVDEI